MMSMSRLFGVMVATILVWSGLLVSPALAEKRVALVIGNGAYKAASRLANPVSDASDMASALRSVGFSVDVALNVDRARFETAISEFSDKASGADVALVFYAGHGMGLGSETHLLPVDADFRNEFEARNQTVGLTALLGTLEGRAKTVLAFVDACRDNPLADRLAASMRGAGRAVSVTRGLARIEVGASDTLVVYATTPGRTAAYGTGRNSPFTTALLAHLGTEGMEIEALLKRVSAQVQELTGNQQKPERLSRLKREFYFKPVGAPSVPPTPVDLSAAASADFDRAKAVGTVAAWDMFLGRHPSGHYADLARQARERVSQVAGTFPAARPSGAVSCRDRSRLVSASARPAVPLSADEVGCLQPKDIFKECADCPEMVVVPAGSFTMGSPESEEGRRLDEGPQRTVTIGRALAVGRYPVTVDQYRVFVEATGHSVGSKCWTFENGKAEERSGRSWSNPGFSQSGSHPVACVNWHDAQAYVAWLSRTSGQRYRLLSEAEWEYSARGRTEPGQYPRYFYGDDASSMCRYGNVADQTAKRSIEGASGWKIFDCDDGFAYTSPVGRFEPNAFGLYDVHGNVWQWVEDCFDSYDEALSDGSAQTNSGCQNRVMRGGSRLVSPMHLRSAYRYGYTPVYRLGGVGFRVARTLPCRDRPRLVSASARPAAPLTAEEAGCLQSSDVFKECADCPEMVVVPAGSFLRGSPETEEGREADEGPQRTLTIGLPLAVGRYPVTVSQYRAFVEATGRVGESACETFENGKWVERNGLSWRNPGFSQSGAHPVVCVNWQDARAYVSWLSRTSGERYRLLSEAEWEYSARARTRPDVYPRYFYGNDASSMCRYGNGADQTAKRSIEGSSGWTFFNCDDGFAYTSPVGRYEANAFGLHDVHGNVWQWVEDCYVDSYRGALSDGPVQTTRGCDKRVLRGGSWSSIPGDLRSAVRDRITPDDRFNTVGFRVARTLHL